MKLKEVKISNYRSIESETFTVEEKDGSYTFTLIGVNESGKSSFLNAVALIDDGIVSHPKDFFDDAKPIEISLKYTVEPADHTTLVKELQAKSVDREITSKMEIDQVEVGVTFQKETAYARKNFEKINFKNKTLPGYFLSGNLAQKKAEGQTAADLNFEDFLKLTLPDHFYKNSHFITFWKSDARHLINEKINLDTFAANPEETSVPLYNCFKLAKIDDIKGEILAIKTDSARRQNLADKLGDSITAHIKKVWPNHAVVIKFNIDAMVLEFLIEDDNVKYKMKTTNQRSDGFRQFISFLLTVSAEHSTNVLSNSLLLLDEPETHLHPKAQEFLKDELIKITKNTKNNIVFFATHSSYMIDKTLIGRCYKVDKVGNLKTRVTKITGPTKTYAEVNYEVFDVVSSDYHNQLYGAVQENSGIFTEKEFEDFLETKGVQKTKDYVRVHKDGNVSAPYKSTLSTYIRNMIHHPENTNNKLYSDAELKESIKVLLGLVK